MRVGEREEGEAAEPEVNRIRTTKVIWIKGRGVRKWTEVDRNELNVPHPLIPDRDCRWSPAPGDVKLRPAVASARR